MFAPFFLDGFCVHFFVKKWGTLCSLDVAIGAIQVLCAPFFAPRRQKTCLSRGPRPRPAQSALAWHRLLLLLVVVVVCFSSAPSTAMPPKEKSALGGLLTRPKNALFSKCVAKNQGKNACLCCAAPAPAPIATAGVKKKVWRTAARGHIFGASRHFVGSQAKKRARPYKGRPQKSGRMKKKGARSGRLFLAYVDVIFCQGLFFICSFFLSFFSRCLSCIDLFYFLLSKKEREKSSVAKKQHQKEEARAI